MIGVKTRMALCFAVVIGIVALGVFAVYHQSPAPREKPRKNFDRTVAEGMRLWNPKSGVDSIRFDACRIEKMRLGAFALGGFNVLCLDGLVLNLPLPVEAEDSEGKREEVRGKRDGCGATEALAGLLPQSFLQRAGVPAKRFSGIRIKGLAVNRVENRREVPVFAADAARNRGRMLELMNCRVFADDGSTNSVGVAQLVLQPAPALVWKGGMRKLDELLPNFREVKGENP